MLEHDLVGTDYFVDEYRNAEQQLQFRATSVYNI
jgi:hypothetical protein